MAGNKGVNKLARVLEERMRGTNKNEDQLELGRILADLSLKTDLFPIAIPKGQYMIARQLTHKTTDPLTTTKSGEQDHNHSIVLPESMYPLKAGDRVLVAWTNKGTTPVIIDVVVAS